MVDHLGKMLSLKSYGVVDSYAELYRKICRAFTGLATSMDAFLVHGRLA
jgi:hypothetical protein